MTFFYDLNKRLADIGSKQQVNEDTQVNEKYMGFSKLEKEIAKRGDVRDPGAVAASIGRKKYGKEKFQKAAAAGKKLGEQDDIRPPRNPQALDYQQGPEDDEEYRRHHGLDDPDRRRERKLRATDYKTLDRLERRAVDRAKQIEEEPNEGNEFSGELAKAKASGAKEFKVDGKTYPVKEGEVEEGKHDPHPLDDPLTRFRKKHAPSVMRDPKGREEVSKLDTEYGERKKTAYGRGEEEDEDEEDGKKKAKPAGEKRGRGRPKGSKRAIGAKGPTGRSKLLTREEDMSEDYDRDEYDEEGEMAKTDARTIEDAAEELQSILDDQENLPEWVQKKISLAKDYVDRARDYMKANRPGTDGEMSLPEAANGEFTQADWNRIVGLKRMLMRMNPRLEPEDAEQKAAEKLGYDYEDVLTWIESDKNLEEKAVSKAQRKAAGIAYAAKKGDIPKSELRGASKEMAKMKGGDLKKFAKTKEKGLPAKKTEEVEETTTAGNVAPGGDAPAKDTKKGGMTFGKGIYDSMNRELEDMIAESMSINMSDSTEGGKSLTVTASDEDAMKLAAILKMAGLGSQSHDAEPSGGCGTMEEAYGDVEATENAPDYPTNTETSDDAMQYAGGLNKPKLQVNPNNKADNPLAMKSLGDTAHTLNLGDSDNDELRRIREMAGIQEEKKGKPDFLDMDKDGDKEEPMKKAIKDKEQDKVDEAVERGLWNLWKRIQ